jgi:hypothetical protein
MPISPDRKGNTLCIYLKDLIEEMKEYPEVNWSVICRQAIRDYMELRKKMRIR